MESNPTPQNKTILTDIEMDRCGNRGLKSWRLSAASDQSKPFLAFTKTQFASKSICGINALTLGAEPGREPGSMAPGT